MTLRDAVAEALASEGPPGTFREHGTLGVEGGARPTPYAVHVADIATAAFVGWLRSEGTEQSRLAEDRHTCWRSLDNASCGCCDDLGDTLDGLVAALAAAAEGES